MDLGCESGALQNVSSPVALKCSPAWLRRVEPFLHTSPQLVAPGSFLLALILEAITSILREHELTFSLHDSLIPHTQILVSV